MPDNSALTKDPWYAKPSIRRMVEGSNGYTVFDDRQVPNRTRDPYAPSRDFTYYMQYVLFDVVQDLFNEDYSPSITEMIKKWGVENTRLIESCNSLADMISGFVGCSSSHVGQTLDEVAEKYGYKQLEPEAKTLVEAIVGRYFIASFFFAAKCLTPEGGKPMGDIGYEGAFAFMANETKQALDGVETPYARKLKDAREKKEDN